MTTVDEGETQFGRGQVVNMGMDSKKAMAQMTQQLKGVKYTLGADKVPFSQFSMDCNTLNTIIYVYKLVASQLQLSGKTLT